MARVAMQFDASTITQGSSINSATLKLKKVGHYQNSTENFSVPTNYYVYGVSSPWEEENVAWESWQEVGGDYNPEAIDSFYYDGSSNYWFTFDVTPLVQSWVDSPSGNMGILLDAPGGDDEGGPSMDQESWFVSSESPQAELRPQIIIETGGTAIANSSLQEKSVPLIHKENQSLYVESQQRGELTLFSLQGQRIAVHPIIKGVQSIPLKDIAQGAVIVQVVTTNRISHSTLVQWQ